MKLERLNFERLESPFVWSQISERTVFHRFRLISRTNDVSFMKEKTKSELSRRRDKGGEGGAGRAVCTRSLDTDTRFVKSLGASHMDVGASRRWGGPSCTWGGRHSDPAKSSV